MPSLVYPNKQVAAERYIYSLLPLLYLPLWKRDGGAVVSDDATGSLFTVTGAVKTPQGRRFDGVDDRLQTTLRMVNIKGDSGSVLAWVRKEGPGSTGGNGTIIEKGWASQYGLRVPNEGTIQVRFLEATGAATLNWTSARVWVEVGKWVQIGFIFKRPTAHIVVNGQIVESNTWDYDIVESANQWCVVGGVTTPGAWVINGLIGEIVATHRGLSQLEALNYFNITKWRYL